MDDPSWAWPAWKFDMKRGDLFTKLHDQYNTYPSPFKTLMPSTTISSKSPTRPTPLPNFIIWPIIAGNNGSAN
ncbi:hypothetical protein EDB81DRAFT_819690 [Dactylonectria macrodidyma]|uniref:Uncharacterized protein n=1 Tax=Dactylonectria macrodidyma TaxID=307937 RepID=A0A9P9DB04_9HYPO|nr:hypothetical protein EDB81DRAFT_819649 [Dactylonectria macrodidyma]KAH7115537.1 hypothetical protein EDB81DRAFT_819690 [Dactylonectria macrodidyma]